MTRTKISQYVKFDCIFFAKNCFPQIYQHNKIRPANPQHPFSVRRTIIFSKMTYISVKLVFK